MWLSKKLFFNISRMSSKQIFKLRYFEEEKHITPKSFIDRLDSEEHMFSGQKLMIDDV